MNGINNQPVLSINTIDCFWEVRLKLLTEVIPKLSIHIVNLVSIYYVLVLYAQITTMPG